MRLLFLNLFIFLVFGLFTIKYANAKPVTIVSWGGAYTEMQKLGPAAYATKKNWN